MPFRSEAQRRKFAELVKQGKMSESTFKEWNRATPKGKLPERIHPKFTSTDELRSHAKHFTKRK